MSYTDILHCFIIVHMFTGSILVLDKGEFMILQSLPQSLECLLQHDEVLLAWQSLFEREGSVLNRTFVSEVSLVCGYLFVKKM
jgi:hypothetical protein